MHLRLDWGDKLPAHLRAEVVQQSALLLQELHIELKRAPFLGDRLWLSTHVCSPCWYMHQHIHYVTTHVTNAFSCCLFVFNFHRDLRTYVHRDSIHICTNKQLSFADKSAQSWRLPAFRSVSALVKLILLKQPTLLLRSSSIILFSSELRRPPSHIHVKLGHFTAHVALVFVHFCPGATVLLSHLVHGIV